MSSVGLLFVGAVLFLNGLLFLGKADAKGVAVFNLFVGVLQTAIPFYLIATAKALKKSSPQRESSCSGSPISTWASSTLRASAAAASAGTRYGSPSWQPASG
jgi:AmiS/UreI family transporter